MTIDEVREAIGRIRIMPMLSEPLREKLVDIFQRICQPRSMPPGRTFIHEGEHVDDKGYILVQGEVLVHKENFPDVTCGSPELIGEIQQFNPTGLRTATVSGATEGIILRFIWADFWRELEKDCDTEEIAAVREALERQAWEHFIR
jgi:CRP-like cAMP-binding protein